MDMRIIVVGIALVLFGVYTHSDVLEGSCSNESVQCELSVNEMTVCNDSDESQKYVAYFSGASANWFNVIPNKVTLEPGECRQLNVFTVAECYADPGKYFAQLIVQNSEKLTLQCELNLLQGHFVSIDIEPSTRSATQCEEKTYDIVLTNNTIVPNQNTERVDLSLTGLPQDWYTLEEQRVLVEKGESEIVKLTVKPPCQADFGTYDFKVRASLPNPNFFAEDSATYILAQGQRIDIDLDSGFDGDNFSACLETTKTAKIKIKNSGKLQDKLKITLEGATFAKIDKKQLDLAPGQEQDITVTFAQNSQKEGNYDFTLKVQSEKYDYSTSKQFDVKLQDCYNLDVQKLEGQTNVCVEDKPVYKFSLTNNKTETLELEASVIGIPAALNAKKITIRPGETKQIDALIDVSKLASEAKASRTDIAAEIIIDTSGSMVEKIGENSKMDIAKGAIINLVNNISEIDLGLRVLGQGELCENSEQVYAVSKLNIAQLTDKVSQLSPMGKTPIAQALIASISDFNTTKEKVIVLVSDGKETCEGDISAAAREVAKNGIKVYTIGFDIDEEGKGELQEIANRTKGKYFDAQNSQELLNVLKTISQELDIVPADRGQKNFTIQLKSDHFSYEKDFSLTISDCYNAALVVPELNLCPGVTKGEIFTIVNLGSQPQEFDLSYSPNWINGQSSVRVAAGQSVTVPFSAATPKPAAENSFRLRAVSDTLEFEQSKSINYLSQASCFGIDIIVLEPTLDAKACEGVRQTLILENRGVTTQKVSIKADKPYVYMVQNSVDLEAGERQEVYFFVSPPFDLPQTTFITFSATTDNGFSTSAQVKLVVHGNEEDFGLGEVDLRIRDLNITTADVNRDVEIKFNIYNDSNRTLEVFNVKVLDYNGVVQLSSRTIGARKSIMARALVDFAQTPTGTVTVPISIETDEGTFTRNLTFNYATTTEAPGVSIGTGLFGLAPFSTIILGALILIVIALIAFSTYKAVQKEEEQKTQIQQIQDQADEMPPIVQEEQPEAAEKKPKKKTQKKK